ncbi:hypothetical protein A3A38_00210 [Candidatus Kaiserbacteria bacterium RIFCSPLOWO2_01_FULL_53_17]|uniref:D,D-heptose 1,7-bisphosphate phosphatase n=1 Tax=Candidatus Kaiserbacteria bacterium RIFCSPLOWO2_01_FULL_53_17 TaxID=1798511 RepID=A0A1F6EG75_9BACT|nr:MAG: hypothetical protein A3A38_00210 [Candidatus Kaiserbacteria bacterium RIFCSPLOWO2_01_FULL_53_17]
MGINSKKLKLIRQVWAKKNRVARPAVFFDRDGVLIRLRNVVSEKKHLRLLIGTGGALKALQDAGYLLIIATNQPNIEKGIINSATVKELNNHLQRELRKHRTALHAAYTCPHRFGSNCACRKPGLGLIKAARKDFKIDMKHSWLIGDTTRDMETGKRTKLKTILVKTGNGGKDRRFFKTKRDFIARNLHVAANIVAKKRG